MYCFDDGWMFNNNVCYQQFEMSGQLVVNNVLLSIGCSFMWIGIDQIYEGQIFSIDINVQCSFNIGFGKYEIMLGMDYFNLCEDMFFYICMVVVFNVYNLVYGVCLNCLIIFNIYILISICDIGLYVCDNICFGECW